MEETPYIGGHNDVIHVARLCAYSGRLLTQQLFTPLACSLVPVHLVQGSAIGAVVLVAQGEEWHIAPNTINHSQSGNVFMIGMSR